MSESKEWTLMFYFASDNTLAPGIVSQLKALKNAGYHQKVNVVAYFDPHPYGTPAHIFDVNGFEKLGNDHPKIGIDANDPFVRNLMFDRLWGDEVGRDGKTPIRKLIQQIAVKPTVTYTLPKPPPPPSDRTRTGNHSGESNPDPGPKDSLATFLDFCATQYKANRYMLFILGHGLVVGDDVFLYDEHAARHSVTLSELSDVLAGFKDDIKKNGAEFELVSFHSCSMSSLEVAFQLQGTANYMLASQGPAFVGSWPYTQILMRMFNDVHNARLKTAEHIEGMLKKIFYYVLHNSTDFLLAGYCFDLVLCDLSSSKIPGIEGPIKELSEELIGGLASDILQGCILLAHWKSQSYWKENYTDLYDFCFCLFDYCEKFSKATNNPSPYKNIQGACKKVMEALVEQNPNSPIILAEFAGPESQYSHGFSVFFPWTRPTEDRAIMGQYEYYKFKKTGWLDFLNAYWGPKDHHEPIRGTMRDSHKEERDSRVRSPESTKYDDLLEDIASLMFNVEGPLNTSGTLNNPPPPPPEKVHPQDPMGDGCTCGSIKNYRRDTRKRTERSTDAQQTIPVGPKVFQIQER